MNTKGIVQKNGKFPVSNIMFLGGLLILLYHVAIGCLLTIPFMDVLRGVGMQFFGLFLPGMALWVSLHTDKQNILTALTICYALGYIFNIISYFLLVPFGVRRLVPIYVMLVSLISLSIIYRKGKVVSLRRLQKEDSIFVILYLIYLCMNTIAYSGANALPIITESAWYPQDLLYWIENAGALIRQFPPMEPRADLDSTLYYHYFSSIQLAFSALATGVDLFTLGVSFFSLGKTMLYFGGGDILFQSVLKRKSLVLFSLILMCFGDGFGNLAGISWVSHTWSHPFGFDIGFAFGFIFLYFFYLQYNKELFDKKILIFSVMTFFVCAGVKMPIAVVVIVAAGIVCFSWLGKKQYKLAFTYGISLLVVFVIVAVACAGVGLQEGQTGSFSATDFIQSSSLMQVFYTNYAADGVKWILGILLCVIHCIVANPLIIILYIFGFFALLADKKMRTPMNLGLFLAGAFGLLLGVFNIQPGRSQMYFTMAAFIPCILLGLIWLDTNWSEWDLANRRLVMAVCNCLLVIEVYLAFFHGYTYYGNGISSAIELGFRNMFLKEDAIQENREDGLQKADLEALEWVRDNISLDSILLADRSVVSGNSKYMYYGAFSERQMYIEGDAYFRERYVQEREHMNSITSQVFMNSDEALEMAISEGVDYILQTKWLTPDFSPDSSMVELVYEGETINVYEIVQ